MVPCLSFGENSLYDQVFSERIKNLQVWGQKKLGGISPPVFYSNASSLFWLPKRKKLNTVIGGEVDTMQVVKDVIRKRIVQER